MIKHKLAKRITQSFFFLLAILPLQVSAQKEDWKNGILVDEFIFEQAPFPECHASTIAETPDGFIAAWFGGTKEGAKDVCIWTSRLVSGKWTAPQQVADGVIIDTTRYACYNPVLYYNPACGLLLFYKIGP